MCIRNFLVAFNRSDEAIAPLRWPVMMAPISVPT